MHGRLRAFSLCSPRPRPHDQKLANANAPAAAWLNDRRSGAEVGGSCLISLWFEHGCMSTAVVKLAAGEKVGLVFDLAERAAPRLF
jgi:hypothetical protein